MIQPFVWLLKIFMVIAISTEHRRKRSTEKGINWHINNHRICERDMGSNCYDYIIIGAGTAGSILARKLSDDPENRVLLIEQGYWSSLNPHIQDASKWYSLLTDPLTDSGYYSVPQAALNNRSIPQPRAKVTGGCNNHNAMAYIIGNRKDFDERWGPVDGWKWSDLSPYWNFINRTYPHTQIDPKDPLMMQLLKSGEELGYKYNSDPNNLDSPQGQGGIAPRIYTSKKLSENYAQRVSTWNEYVEPIIPRRNLDILVFTHTNKILFDRNLRAIGIETFNLGSKEYDYFYGRKEVIISAGVFGSPKLLLLSGIGPCDELEKLNITCLSNVPGVGKNLQDHTFIHLWSPPLLNQNIALPKPVLGGWGAVAIEENGEYYHVLTFDEINGKKAIRIFVETFHYQSRGTVTLKDNNPLSAPLIDPKYLSTEFDEKKTLTAIKVGRAFLKTRTLSTLTAEEDQGVWPANAKVSDAELLNWIKTHSSTDYHVSSTCKMGNDLKDDPMAVVDRRLRVRNVKGLRVADASIMPVMISGNPNQITMIIGFKAVDMINDDNQ